MRKDVSVRHADSYSRAYIRHLLKAKEMLGMRPVRIGTTCIFTTTMMEEIRDALDAGNFAAYKEECVWKAWMRAGSSSKRG